MKKGGIPMKKKTLCGLLSVVMMLGAFPVSAFAENDLNELKKSLDFRDAEEDMSGEGWEWDANDQLLTLKDFRYEVPKGSLSDKAAIYLPKESYVEIEGEDNYLAIQTDSCDAFYCEGEVTFSGDGKMELEMNTRLASAFYVYKGPILFDDEVEFTIDSKGYIVYMKHPKGDDPRIIIEDEAKLIFLEEHHRSRNIMLIVKYDENESDNWLDYAEVYDDWDETVHLVAKDSEEAMEAKKEETPDVSVPEEPAAPEEPVKQSTYQITIGNKAIKKDGYVTYVSDAKPYLSHGYTMLPLRALLNVTGSDTEIAWDAVTKTVTVRQNSDAQYTKTAYIVIGDSKITTPDGKMDVYTPAELQSSRAFVSLRDWMNILSALDMPASDLSWDPKTQTVTFVK